MATMQITEEHQSRVEFEAWARRACYEMERHDSGQYARSTTEQAWQSWQAARTLPAPENVRDGEPYDNPAFEELARTMGVWGTAQAALCAQFFLAGRALPARGVDTMLDTPAGMEPVAWLASYQDRGGNEASYTTTHHALAVENDANGTPQALYTAAQVQAMGRVPPGWWDVMPDRRYTGKQQATSMIDYNEGWNDCQQTICAALAAAPRPPAAQVPIPSNSAGLERKPLDRIAVLVKIDAVLCKEKNPLQAAEEICAMANQGITHPTGD